MKVVKRGFTITRGLLIGLLVVFSLLAILVIWGIVYRPKFVQTYVEPGAGGDTKPLCLATPVPCETNEDCQACGDNVETQCVELARHTPEQEKVYGKSGKFCLPAKPEQKCNEKLGGLYVWTGWSEINRQEFDCLCSYPEIAGGPGCSQLNPNVCQGGTYTYDAVKDKRGPKPSDCKCGSGHNLMVPRGVEGAVPLCIPADEWLCKDKAMCEGMYSDTSYIEP